MRGLVFCDPTEPCCPPEMKARSVTVIEILAHHTVKEYRVFDVPDFSCAFNHDTLEPFIDSELLSTELLPRRHPKQFPIKSVLVKSCRYLLARLHLKQFSRLKIQGLCICGRHCCLRVTGFVFRTYPKHFPHLAQCQVQGSHRSFSFQVPEELAYAAKIRHRD